ncbi:MAG: Flp pilus assembly complex ATPase component TadA [Clostridiales bacterium]|jgi:twitching motility protein PilT|nr:Flp pilus assembly complex ATPase component TadA [Clostridiales bacterium]
MYTLDIISKILESVNGSNVTDIHLTAGTVPAVRIDGKLSYTTRFSMIRPDDIWNIIDQMLNDEHKKVLKEQNYLCVTVVLDNIGRVRANIFKQRGSYALNIKILDQRLKTPEELGIPQVVIDLHKKESGLILICGNKSSGKSTTVTSIIKKICTSRACQIITIEDPIQYLHKHDKAIVNQIEIGLDVNSFEEALNCAMTQDADVIMTSFAGSPEIFSALLSAAENGHLVIATLQTVDTISTIEYILSMFPAERREHVRVVLGNVLQAIISQKLLPAKDGSSYKLAAEVMLANQAMKNLIIENKIHQIPALIKASKALGMITMEDSVKELYRIGAIDESWLNM